MPNEDDKKNEAAAPAQTVEGTETHIDEKTGRILGPGDETLAEEHPEIDPSPEKDSPKEDAIGKGGVEALADENQSDNEAAVGSVSKPNTVVTATGTVNGTITVPRGTTVSQALATFGVADGDYKITGPNGDLSLDDTINEDVELRIVQ